MTVTYPSKQLLSDAVWSFLGQLLSASALLIGTRCLTELVSPGVYGHVALLNGFVALGVAVFSYPFICAGMRLSPECVDEHERSVLRRFISRLVNQSVLLACCLLGLIFAVVGFSDHHSLVLIVSVGLLLTVTVRREVGIQLMIGERNHRMASLWQTSDSVLRPVLAIALVYWGAKQAEWVMLGYILASLLATSFWSFLTRKKAIANDKQTHSVRKIKRDVWAYALPLIPMELIYWVNGLGDRYIIDYFMSASDVGLYAATYLIINEAFNRSAMILLRTFQPAYFEACSKNQTDKSYKILWLWIRTVCAMGVAGVTLLYFTKDWVATLLLAKTYHAAVELMPAIAIGCAVHALGTVLAQPLLAQKLTRLMLWGRLSGAVTAVICLPLMVQHWGLFGAALANPIYFGVEAVVLACLAKPWQRVCSNVNLSAIGQSNVVV